MKVRQLKHTIYAMMMPSIMMYSQMKDRSGQSSFPGLAYHGYRVIIDEVPSSLGDLLARKIREDKIQAQEIEEAKQEFVCQKVKDGTVVDTFDTREEALELVKKHAKQKKAKLQVLDTLTGELVLFSEEDLA